MHILIVADGRSPIARRWIQTVQALDHQVSLVSTYPAAPVPGVQTQVTLPVAFAGFASGPVGISGPSQRPSVARRWVKRFRSLALAGREQFGPLSLPFYARRYQQIVRALQPDLVHALRIPFEGMLAAYTPRGVPLAISIWGNDLTLHGERARQMHALTRRALLRADGLLADALRDIRLAHAWGYPLNRPTQVLPGNGGLDLNELNTACPPENRVPLPPLPTGAPLVLNPRGIRPAYARTDVFFQAVPLVLQRRPDVHFLCAAMAGQVEALAWLKKLRIEANVHLLPFLPQAQLWDLFRSVQVTSSVTSHDGTPNTLIEAMACGAFPVAGDIESLREWITPGINGLLVEPGKPQAVAEAFLLAIENDDLRQRAAEINQQLVLERAEVSRVRSQLAVFYQWVWGLR
jgi:glycosyltransferase involved in cell wall biosynthesis